MRARLRRLEGAGLVRRRREGPNEPLRVVVTERGGAALGESVPTPRGLEPLGHELAVIKRVIAIVPVRELELELERVPHR